MEIIIIEDKLVVAIAGTENSKKYSVDVKTNNLPQYHKTNAETLGRLKGLPVLDGCVCDATVGLIIDNILSNYP